MRRRSDPRWNSVKPLQVESLSGNQPIYPYREAHLWVRIPNYCMSGRSGSTRTQVGCDTRGLEPPRFDLLGRLRVAEVVALSKLATVGVQLPCRACRLDALGDDRHA